MTPLKNELIIKNLVSAYCAKNGIDRREFIARCLQSKATYKGRPLTVETAGRVYDGDTGILFGTAVLVAKALGVNVEDLFETN